MHLGKIIGHVSRPQFHPSLLGSLTSLRTYKAPGGDKWERLKAGESNGKLPPRIAQDAVCQIHTGHMTGLWFLPAWPLRLNTNEWMVYSAGHNSELHLLQKTNTCNPFRRC